MIDTMPRSIGLAARYGQSHPRLVDALIALSWLLLSSPTLVLAASTPRVAVEWATGWVGALTFSVIALAIAVCIFVLRRKSPWFAFWLTFVLGVPLLIIGPDLPNLAAAFCIFAIAVYDSTRRAWIAAGTSATLTLSVSLSYLFVDPPFDVPPMGNSPVGDVIAYAITGLLVLLVALMWGQNTGNRRRYIDGLLEHARHLERERDQQAQLAALAERSRITRDVHDIVSHSLSVIVRLADGANAVFDREPERARDAIGQLSGVARSSLTEMRRVIGVLESTPGSASSHVGTGFDDLPRLVEVYQGIGLPVTLSTDGHVPPQSGVQVTVFRVIQEALTNALRHAHEPSFVRVFVESGDDVTVLVENDGATAPPNDDEHVGRGLVGMHERAALYGGTLSAGPEDVGRWSVRLMLPGAGR